MRLTLFADHMEHRRRNIEELPHADDLRGLPSDALTAKKMVGPRATAEIAAT